MRKKIRHFIVCVIVLLTTISLFAACSEGEKGETCLVTLDPNGGTLSGSLTKELTVGSSYVLPVPVRDGYTFDGWCTKSLVRDVKFSVDTDAEDPESVREEMISILAKILPDAGYPTAKIRSLADGKSFYVRVPDIEEALALMTSLGDPYRLEFRVEGKDEELTPEGLWLNEQDLETAYVRNNDGRYMITLEFNEEGTEKFFEATKASVGRVINIWLNGEWLMGPTVVSVISNGMATITSLEWENDYDAANAIAQGLNFAASGLSVRLVEVSEQITSMIHLTDEKGTSYGKWESSVPTTLVANWAN